jgi:hypothetical protein
MGSSPRRHQPDYQVDGRPYLRRGLELEQGLESGHNSIEKKTVIVGTSGKRAGEGCFGPDDTLCMIWTPEADTPLATFIDTAAGTVLAP